MGVDLNKTDSMYPTEWELFLAEFQLHDVAPALPTYSVDHTHSSCLDRWLLRDTAVHQQLILPKVIVSQRAGPAQHSRLYLTLKLARPPSKAQSFQSIPAKAVNPGTLDGQNLMRRLRRAIAPFAHESPQGTEAPDGPPGDTACPPEGPPLDCRPTPNGGIAMRIPHP
jgi:hypothetical protein